MHWWNDDRNLRPLVLFLAAVSLFVILWMVPGDERVPESQGLTWTPAPSPEEGEAEEAETVSEAERQAEREAYLASLEGDGVWRAFGDLDFCLLGDSRIVGFSFYDYLPEERVLAEYGASIPYIRTRLEDFEALAPDTVILAFGINDMLTGIWPSPEDYAAQVLSDVSRLRERVPGADYYVSSILPALPPALTENPVWEEVPAYDRALMEMCAENGLTFIDSSTLARSRTDLYAADGLHLDAAFYPLWGRVMLEAVYDAHLSP